MNHDDETDPVLRIARTLDHIASSLNCLDVDSHNSGGVMDVIALCLGAHDLETAPTETITEVLTNGLVEIREALEHGLSEIAEAIKENKAQSRSPE